MNSLASEIMCMIDQFKQLRLHKDLTNSFTLEIKQHQDQRINKCALCCLNACKELASAETPGFQGYRFTLGNSENPKAFVLENCDCPPWQATKTFLSKIQDLVPVHLHYWHQGWTLSSFTFFKEEPVPEALREAFVYEKKPNPHLNNFSIIEYLAEKAGIAARFRTKSKEKGGLVLMTCNEEDLPRLLKFIKKEACFLPSIVSFLRERELGRASSRHVLQKNQKSLNDSLVLVMNRPGSNSTVEEVEDSLSGGKFLELLTSLL